MEIEIDERTDNPLLARQELRFTINHPQQATPRRLEVRRALAQQLDVAAEVVIVDHMQNRYGVSRTNGYAKVYADLAALKATETAPLLKRHGLGSD